MDVDSSDENEDCLSVNVFTPKVKCEFCEFQLWLREFCVQDPTTISQKLPVLFYIHGGGFIWGSGQTKSSTGSYGPEFFMDTGEVVVVSVNYRLGPFGLVITVINNKRIL